VILRAWTLAESASKPLSPCKFKRAFGGISLKKWCPLNGIALKAVFTKGTLMALIVKTHPNVFAHKVENRSLCHTISNSH
jgi:hypothetical protein